MRKPQLSSIAFAAVLIAAPFAALPGNETSTGEDLYYAHGCYGCHGFNGETGARDLAGTNSPILANVETFLVYLRARGDYQPLLPSTRMPAYPASALSDADARKIYAFISVLELNAPDIEDIPALQEILESAGQQLE